MASLKATVTFASVTAPVASAVGDVPVTMVPSCSHRPSGNPT